MSTALDPALEQFVGRIGVLFERRGGPGMAGRILAFLLAAPDPVQSSSDIAAAVQTSSGTVSINTRLLEEMGLIERTSVPGRRGAFFRAKRGAWATVFQSQIEDIRAFREAYDDVIDALEGADPERLERLEEAREFNAFLEEELPGLIERWNARHR